MFDKLIDWLVAIWDQLIPYLIVDQQFNGVRLRFGKFIEVLQPGIHFKLPFFDKIQTSTVVWTTISLNCQSLTTKDGKDVVIKGIIKYRISDIKTFLLEVWDSKDALSDMTQGIIFDIVKNRTWEDLQLNELKSQITKKTRLEARRWGIEVETVTLSDLARLTSFRVLNDSGSVD